MIGVAAQLNGISTITGGMRLRPLVKIGRHVVYTVGGELIGSLSRRSLAEPTLLNLFLLILVGRATREDHRC